jgi:hypothetical protein
MADEIVYVKGGAFAEVIIAGLTIAKVFVRSNDSVNNTIVVLGREAYSLSFVPSLDDEGVEVISANVPDYEVAETCLNIVWPYVESYIRTH